MKCEINERFKKKPNQQHIQTKNKNRRNSNKNHKPPNQESNKIKLV